LGAATAKLLAREGARVALLSRNEYELAEVAADIARGGGEALVIQADITQEKDLESAVAQIEKEWGRLDVVFANAGVNGVWAPLELLTFDEWEQTIRINLTGTFLTVRSALPLLKRQGGSIVITSSVNGTRMFSNTGATAYSCSKAGQVALAKMLAVELAKHAIRVNVICPGFFESAIHGKTEKRHLEDVGVTVEFPDGTIPLKGGHPGNAEDVAKLVRFLASDDSSHITGTETYIDGGQSLIQG
jgi:NAD(P)-dependent dehydrogenase (short-subunit alcohol dehydrogenase family)